MHNTIANREIVCDVLKEATASNHAITVVTSDSRGSGALTSYGEKYPHNIVEVGIAEQNLVGIAAGLAHSKKRSFAVSPACFLSMRAIEQIKVDVAYSNTNVKLIGISGGVSYGALGMSHHSLQDFAVTRAIPNLQVLQPADRFETRKMMEVLVQSDTPAYIRIGRSPVQDCYTSTDYEFVIGKANTMVDGDAITLVASGETVRVAMDAAELLQEDRIRARVLNYHTIKPFDQGTLETAIEETGNIISIEEHSIYGGLGSAVAEVIATSNAQARLQIIGIADEATIAGTSAEIFAHYGITAEAVAAKARLMVM